MNETISMFQSDFRVLYVTVGPLIKKNGTINRNRVSVTFPKWGRQVFRFFVSYATVNF